MSISLISSKQLVFSFWIYAADEIPDDGVVAPVGHIHPAWQSFLSSSGYRVQILCAHWQNSVGRDWGKIQPFYFEEHQDLMWIWCEQDEVMLASGKLKKECHKIRDTCVLIFQSTGKSWKLSNIHLLRLAMVLYGIGIDVMFFLKTIMGRKGGKGIFSIIKVIIYNKQYFIFLKKSLWRGKNKLRSINKITKNMIQ